MDGLMSLSKRMKRKGSTSHDAPLSNVPGISTEEPDHSDESDAASLREGSTISRSSSCGSISDMPSAPLTSPPSARRQPRTASLEEDDLLVEKQGKYWETEGNRSLDKWSANGEPASPSSPSSRDGLSSVAKSISKSLRRVVANTKLRAGGQPSSSGTASTLSSSASSGALPAAGTPTTAAFPQEQPPSSPVEPPPLFDPDYLFSQPDSPDSIVFADQEGKDGIPLIKGGTLAKLIERLTFDKYVDTNYLQQFLLTYRTFATPIELLRLLILRYNMPDPIKATEKQLAQFRTFVKVVRLRVFNVIKTWVDRHFSDFEDEQLLKELLEFIPTLEKTGMEKPAEFLRENIARKQAEHARERSSQPRPEPAAPASTEIDLSKIDLQELARQMTLLEFEIYRSIKPIEFNNMAWTKGTREERLASSPNVLALIERFNLVSGWVVSTLVFEEDLEMRRDLLVGFIRLANYCRELNNFNGMMEIISGVTATAAYRLKKTWALVDRHTMSVFNELHALMSRDNNFRNFRAALRGVHPPALPYLGMYLTDMMFVDQGNSDLLPGTRLINFHKRRLLSIVMREITQHQQMPYQLQPVPAIADYLSRLTARTEDECYEQSLKVEPREEQQRPDLVRVQATAAAAMDDGAAAVHKYEFPPEYPFREPDTDDNISLGEFDAVHQRRLVRAGTVEKLVERLTFHSYPDSEYMAAFLMTFRSFVAPRRLLDLLLQRFYMPRPLNITDDEFQRFQQTILGPVRLRVLNVLKHWVDRHFDDFVHDKTLVTTFLSFVTRSEDVAPVEKPVEQLRMLFRRKLKQQIDLEEQQQQQATVGDAERASVAASISNSGPDVSVLSLNSAEVAQQLAVLHGRLFAGIDLVALVRWNTDENAADAVAPPAAGALPLELFSDEAVLLHRHSETLYDWTLHAMLTAPDLKTRLSVMTWFIELAEAARQLNDFASMVPIATALNSSYIKSLRRVWQLFPSKEHLMLLQELLRLNVMRDEHNLPAYYQQLKRAPSAPAVLQMKPYFERVVALASQPSRVGDERKLVNFAKRKQLYDILSEIGAYRRGSYEAPEVPALQQTLRHLPYHRETHEKYLSLAVAANEIDDMTKDAVPVATVVRKPSRGQQELHEEAPARRGMTTPMRQSLVVDETSRNAVVASVLADPEMRRSVRDASVEAVVAGIMQPGDLVATTPLEEQLASLREETAAISSLLAIRWNQLCVEVDEITLMTSILQQRLPSVNIERWIATDTNGYVYGWPQDITLLVARDSGLTFLLEARPILSLADISIIVRKREFYVALTAQQEVVRYVVLVPDVGVHPAAAEVARERDIVCKKPSDVAALDMC